MSVDGTDELQKAVYDVLKDSVVIPSSTTPVPVFDHVPKEKNKPYIVIGDSEVDAFDTKDSDGTVQAITIEVYSEYRGRREARLVAGEIYALLHHQNFTVAGQQNILCRFDHANYVTEPDGLTRRATLRYIVLLSDEP